MTRAEAYERVYGTPQWRAARMATLRRDNFRCRCCGRSPTNRRGLVVHHKIPLSAGGAPFELGNLESLCRPCHGDVHRAADMDPQRRAWRLQFGV